MLNINMSFNLFVSAVIYILIQSSYCFPALNKCYNILIFPNMNLL